MLNIMNQKIRTDLVDALVESTGGMWSEAPDYAVDDWASEVAANDTRLGYWESVANNCDQNARVDAEYVSALIMANGGSIWNDHPVYTPQQWRDEVSSDATRLGYWQWVASQIQGTASTPGRTPESCRR